MNTFSWLHLTDLHVGLTDQDWLWPRLKHELYDDLAAVSESSGPVNAVLFSGDLTQSGKRDEYARLTDLLRDLWLKLERLGSRPVLLCVPGNHDLVRPDPKSAVARALDRLADYPDIEPALLSPSTSEYKSLIEAAFVNYTEWWQAVGVPKASVGKPGLMPGDCVATFSNAGISVGVLALNSAFLQLRSGDFKGRLMLHPLQAHVVCGGDVDSWVREHDVALLMTHHDASWLTSASGKLFNDELYTPGRFTAHLFGHMHEPSTVTIAESGAAPRRFWQGPSLYGLESWGESGSTRIHGYSVWRAELADSVLQIRLWPRRRIPKYAGSSKIGPDHGYDLTANNEVLFLDVPSLKRKIETAPSAVAADSVQAALPGPMIVDESQPSLFQSGPDSKGATRNLDSVPRFMVRASPSHAAVREQVQAEAVSHLLVSRWAWIKCDWGLGKDEFVSSCLQRLTLNGVTATAFLVHADQAEDVDALLALVGQQFGMSLQEFAHASLPSQMPVLVLDGVSHNLASSLDADGVPLLIARVVQVLLDFSPGIRIAILSRTQLKGPAGGPTVELAPLDLMETKSYLASALSNPPASLDDRSLDLLYRHSGGLPMHLDRLMERLKVSSLAELVEAEGEAQRFVPAIVDEAPPALTDAIARMAASVDRHQRRAFKLLKVLTVLSAGEPLGVVRRIFSDEPFFEEHAKALMELSLLEVSSISSPAPKLSRSKIESGSLAAVISTKLLRVPRQVQDLVRVSIPEHEYSDIIRRAADIFFGNKWRQGEIQFPALGDGMQSKGWSGYPGNELNVVRNLLVASFKEGDEVDTERVARLALAYAEELLTRDRFREAAIAAEELRALLQERSRTKMLTQATSCYGRALRMLRRRDEAMRMLHEALEVGGEVLTKAEKASIHLNLALICQSEKNRPEALEQAQHVLRLAPKKSGSWMHARLVVAEYLEDGPGKLAAIRKLEREARSAGLVTVANNAAMSLSSEAPAPAESIRECEKVINSDCEAYAKMRAIIAKAEFQGTKELSGRDRILLEQAYSYLYSQRMPDLFLRCHKVLWRLLKAEGLFLRLARVFRYSSFVWRVCGESKHEAKFVEDLETLDSQQKLGPDGSAPESAVDVGYVRLRIQKYGTGSP